MKKIYKLSAFTLFVASLAILFAGIIFAYSYMKLPIDSAASSAVAMGRLIFITRCFEVSILIMTIANMMLGYAILSNLESKQE